jgi:hypothetical protein
MVQHLTISIVLLVAAGCATRAGILLDPAELNLAMMHFYEEPDPKQISVIIRSISDHQVLEREEAIPPITGFLAVAAQRYPSHVEEWSIVISSLPRSDQLHLWRALWLADIPETHRALARAQETGLIPGNQPFHAPPSLRSLYVATASDLDALWGAFFASGDTVYVGRIIAVLDWDLQEIEAAYQQDRNAGIYKPGVWSAAKWSLTANSREHASVLQFCRLQLEAAVEPRASLLLEVVANAEAKKLYSGLTGC